MISRTLPPQHDRMWNQLLGSLCVLCRQPVRGPEAHRQLCAWCLADLPWLPEPEPEPPDPVICRQVTPFAYDGAPRQWVLEAKRETGLVAARVLGNLLAEALLDAYPDGAPRPTQLVPVPLSRRRLLQRGHNQATLIAAPVARRLHLALSYRGARRVRHGRLQPGLNPADRAGNVAGAFVSRTRWHGAVLAIVDDVVTTGATATALAGALLAAGAGAVHLWSPTAARPSS